VRTATEVLLDEISTIRMFHMERAVGVGGSEVKFEPKSPPKKVSKGAGRVKKPKRGKKKASRWA